MTPNLHRKRIAVIGSGISGLASAYFLQRAHEVVLYEAGTYLGGHSNTVDIQVAGQAAAVDTGFLVFNERTYPNLIALFAELEVASYASDMSFGVSMDEGQCEWAGTNLQTVFAQPSNLVSFSFWQMLRDILRFNAAAESNLELALRSDLTLGELIEQGGYRASFRDRYLLPMAAAIWSSSPQDILKFPASTFLRFCLNHALLQVNNRPQWRTVQGGSREYVKKIAAHLPDIRLQSPVDAVRRSVDGVIVHSKGQLEEFDAVVFSTHAPDTLRILQDATAAEKAILGAVRYQDNTAYLHTDISQMPRRKKVWSAWNYLGGKNVDGARSVCVTYWLNQLQNLPIQQDVLLTLNPFAPPRQVLARFSYAHPVIDQAAVHAQQQLVSIQGQHRAWFAGAWTGYGFHEDGLKSALRVARDFAVAPQWMVL